MLNRRRMILMNGQEDDKVKEWVVLENLTFEEERDRFNKTYDDSYDEYICEITFPKEINISETKQTVIFGSWCLYYTSIKPSGTYPYGVFVQQEKITDNTHLVRHGKGNLIGVTYGHKEEVILNNSGSNQMYRIALNFIVPAGTVIKVYAR